jgi:hypothetical protein
MVKVPNQDRFTQDESGQWWYRFSGGARGRCHVFTCETCGEEFVAYPSHNPKFCSRKCAGNGLLTKKVQQLKQHPTRWKGGRTVRRGYVLLFMPDHPSIAGRGTQRKYIAEHRVVMERKLGRLLQPWEQVHHINGDTMDNRPENLQLRGKSHGNGSIARCADCGSYHIVYEPLPDE